MDEGFALNPDGTVTILLNGTEPLTLAAPKIGQYRLLRQQILGLLDRQRVLLAELQERGDKNTTVSEDEMLEKIESDQLAVLQAIFETLGDGNLPPSDDWPAWTLNRTILSRLSVHWREVPLAPGRTDRTRSAQPPSAGIGTLPPLGPA